MRVSNLNCEESRDLPLSWHQQLTQLQRASRCHQLREHCRQLEVIRLDKGCLQQESALRQLQREHRIEQDNFNMRLAQMMRLRDEVQRKHDTRLETSETETRRKHGQFPAETGLGVRHCFLSDQLESCDSGSYRGQREQQWRQRSEQKMRQIEQHRMQQARQHADQHRTAGKSAEQLRDELKFRLAAEIGNRRDQENRQKYAEFHREIAHFNKDLSAKQKENREYFDTLRSFNQVGEDFYNMFGVSKR